MVQYYRDLWSKRSEILAPLTQLTKGEPTKNGPTKWTPACTKTFQQMKSLIFKEIILSYPDFSNNFTIHTDALYMQLGAFIMQEGKPISFYSWKLSKAQINYTMTERNS